MIILYQTTEHCQPHNKPDLEGKKKKNERRDMHLSMIITVCAYLLYLQFLPILFIVYQTYLQEKVETREYEE